MTFGTSPAIKNLDLEGICGRWFNNLWGKKIFSKSVSYQAETQHFLCPFYNLTFGHTTANMQ